MHQFINISIEEAKALRSTFKRAYDVLNLKIQLQENEGHNRASVSTDAPFCGKKNKKSGSPLSQTVMEDVLVKSMRKRGLNINPKNQ